MQAMVLMMALVMVVVVVCWCSASCLLPHPVYVLHICVHSHNLCAALAVHTQIRTQDVHKKPVTWYENNGKNINIVDILVFFFRRMDEIHV